LADSPPPKEATLVQVLADDPGALEDVDLKPAAEPYAGISGPEAMELAREEYQKSNYDEAERLLAVAEIRGENPRSVASARGYIAEARTRAGAVAPSDPGGTGAGPDEADPGSGGFLVP
jgi:hypothetical protein